MIRRTQQLGLCFLIVAAGCNTKVTDTEHRTFSFECGGAGCELTLQAMPNDKPQSEASPHQFTVYSETRVLTACPRQESEADFDCRPLTCETSALCSQLGGREFACENALCQAPERGLAFADRLALCLATTGHWRRTPLQLERLTLARACRPPCFLPANCLQL